MIERIESSIYLVCDECGEEQEAIFERDDFQSMIEHYKALGGDVVPPSGTSTLWTHLCPSCVQHEREGDMFEDLLFEDSAN